MDENKVKREHSRLVSLLSDVPDQQRAVLEGVIENLAWQRVKLDEAREEIASIVCEYDNGGGQRGMRVNPAFKAYTDLWRAYMVGIKELASNLPKELQDEVVSDGISVLEQVRKMRATG